MIDRVVVLSGPISSGKSTLAKGLERRFDMVIFKTNSVLKQRVKPHLVNDRKALQDAGEHLDRSTRGTWVRDSLNELLKNQPAISSVVVDSVRIIQQVDALRKAFGSSKVVHIHLTALDKDLKKRYEHRPKLGRPLTFTEARKNATEQQVDTLRNSADVVINTKRCTEKDVFTRACCHLNLRCGKGLGYVDVLIGGQYGSEGKGQIAAYLASEYDFLIRVGGPNAGHKVYEEPDSFTHHQLPSGTRKCQARLLIGPGATLYVPKLLKEIADCKVESDRLYIDEQAMIISDVDISDEQKSGVSDIGSTIQGVGAAMARRITGRSHKTHLQMAKDIAELRPYVRGRILELLDDAYSQGNSMLLEGTQGTGLSLYHGFYPYVTSRDTTVAGCLAEAGVPWNRVRRVIMVCRTHPIRVQNPRDGWSGPMSQEISLLEISKRSGISLHELQKTETTSTTGRKRRICEFDWQLLRIATLINGPTDIALTFADYLSKKNRTAKRFDQLYEDTINFIQEVELVTGAPVSLISTGFNDRSVIDRRRW
jgi:adenylosuccinate synthase